MVLALFVYIGVYIELKIYIPIGLQKLIYRDKFIRIRINNHQYF